MPKDINESIQQYWSKGYNAPNVESHVFRLCARILKPQFDLPSSYERLLDFGCGQGAAVNYFNSIGFDARGCDISDVDINVAKLRYSHLRDKFAVSVQDPAQNDHFGWPEDISVVVAVQALYYLSRDYFSQVMEKLHASMAPGALIYATMMGENHTFFANSHPSEDDWLRRISFSDARQAIDDYYLSFVADEDDLKRKFSMFEPVHIGHYSMQLQDYETNNWHWTFLGRKK